MLASISRFGCIYRVTEKSLKFDIGATLNIFKFTSYFRISFQRFEMVYFITARKESSSNVRLFADANVFQ
jgi:hypothetical protein